MNGSIFSTNASRPISLIGKNSDALICFTNIAQCCSSTETGREGMGNFRFPNDSLVPYIVARSKSFSYRRRNSKVLLTRNSDVKTLTSGIYTCEIPDVNRNDRLLKVHLYSGEQPCKL